MRNASFFWILIISFLLVDIYVFFAVRTLFHGRGRTIFAIAYWLVSAATVSLLLSFPYLQDINRSLRNLLMVFMFSMVLAKFAAALFFAIDDLRRAVQWLIGLFGTTAKRQQGEGITRSAFMTWLGIVAGGSLFTTFLYGLGNKYNYKVRKIALKYDNLPTAFKWLKIVQISDVHSGSFTNKAAVSKGIDMILAQKPDVIFFTGDLVNNRADEMKDYIDVFSRLKAPMGVYSILGNHDYGDYDKWESAAAKAQNLQTLKGIHGRMGWRLLLDEHVPLEKNGGKIGLIGVENISGKNFHSYGNLAKAAAGADYPFKILLSHDPSHWNKEVTTQYTDIDLTLSGHTHGMQFGVEVPGFRWSPVQYVYKQWAGLYENDKQKLYVNRGYGFIGYPGRVGIMPEITVFTLA
ncbi:MAG: metallophosphoesterase [Niabella sp.]